MNIFDTIHTNYEHHFVKSNPLFLESMFGSKDLMPLWIADMDFKIAEPITNELQRLVDRGVYAYEFNPDSVFKTISDWNFKRHQLKLETKAFIQVSGVLTGIALLIRELTKENDNILIQTPVYHQFHKAIETANRKIISNPLKVVEGKYEMDFEDLEQKLQSENIKLIILCNPHNPVGRVWNRKELQKLISLANTYNVTIVSDEIHADIIYSKTAFTSIASFNNESHITILGSPAKTFGMQSISNGYLYIPNKDVFNKIKSTVSSMYLDHGNAFSTFATIAAYTKGEAWVNELLVYLENSINWILEFLQKEIPEITFFVPEGTYQIWLDFGNFNLSEEALKELIFSEAQLALTPGTWFSKDHSQFMRMNIATPLSNIQEAFYRLRRALDEKSL